MTLLPEGTRQINNHLPDKPPISRPLPWPAEVTAAFPLSISGLQRGRRCCLLDAAWVSASLGDCPALNGWRNEACTRRPRLNGRRGVRPFWVTLCHWRSGQMLPAVTP